MQPLLLQLLLATPRSRLDIAHIIYERPLTLKSRSKFWQSRFLPLQLWVAYAPCGSQHMDAVQVTLVQIDVIKRLTESYPQHLQLVRTADGEDRAELVGITTRMILQNVAPPEKYATAFGLCLFVHGRLDVSLR